MTGRICPFCGLATDVPHETQKGCIDALHGEIARVREVLDNVRSGGALGPEPIEERETV